MITQQTPTPSDPCSRRVVLGAGAIIVLAAFAAYANSLSAPFFFDDSAGILENPTIRQLWPPSAILSPPGNGSGVTGRPMVNLSLALNYALGGHAVTVYHVTNVLIHALAGLTLFGVVRRTLVRPSLNQRFGTAALPLAFFTAVAWTLHPLQTESVVCVIQRTELIVGLFYLLTLYCFVRAVDEDNPAPRSWLILAVVACFLGMASKEVMVSAPLLVLLYDRTFVAGSFQGAWQRRRKFYAGLAATWLLLAYLVTSGGGSRGEAAGFGLGVTWWSYALKQCAAIVLYLRLAVWPHPLVVYYGTDTVTNPADVWPQIVLLASVVAAVIVALWRRPALGFLGFWFLAILAPSSSVIPLVSQTVAEHRMYLPLAAVVLLGVISGHAVAGRRGALILGCIVPGLAAVTVRRNDDYHSVLSIWSDTVAKSPHNDRAHVNLGGALKDRGRQEEALAEFQTALRLNPQTPEALNNIATLLLETGQPGAAIAPCEAALRLKPDFALAHSNLGSALAQTGRPAEAIACFKTALRLKPGLAEAHSNLAGVFVAAGRIDEAIEHCEAAIRAKPELALAHFNLGNALAQRDPDRAIAELRLSLRLNPEKSEAHSNLGSLYYRKGLPKAAIPHYEAALRIRPDYFEAHNNLAGALFQTGRPAEAVAHYREAIRLQPGFAEAHCNLALVLSQTGQIAEAIAEYETALRLQPDYPIAQQNLARLREMRRP